MAPPLSASLPSSGHPSPIRPSFPYKKANPATS